jgi:hypothetical protein
MERIATDCEKIALEVAYRFQGRNTYFRLSVQQGLQQKLRRNPLTLAEIQSLTKSYLRSPDTSDTLNNLVSSLLRAIEVSAWTTTRDHFEATLDEYISAYNKLIEDISVASVELAVQEGVLSLETVRVCAPSSIMTQSNAYSQQDIKHSEDYWLIFAEMISNQFNSMDHRMIVGLQEPLSSNPLWSPIKHYFGFAFTFPPDFFSSNTYQRDEGGAEEPEAAPEDQSTSSLGTAES